MKMGNVIAFTAACTLAFATTAASAETVWDMSVVWPEGNFHTQNAMAFAEGVKEVTDGEVVITVHSGGALGIKGPEGMAAVRDGLVPIADILLNQQVGEAPVLGIETLPFMAPTMAVARAVTPHLANFIFLPPVGALAGRSISSAAGAIHYMDPRAWARRAR